MEILEKISSFVLPCVVFFIGLILLFGKGDFFSHFLDGARDGMRSAVKHMSVTIISQFRHS